MCYELFYQNNYQVLKKGNRILTRKLEKTFYSMVMLNYMLQRKGRISFMFWTKKFYAVYLLDLIFLEKSIYSDHCNIIADI
jgi:hypothetical protein